MKWLLWKDYRHNRLIVFAGLFLLFAPYVIGTCVGCGDRWIDWEKYNWHGYRPMPWNEVFVQASIFSLIVSQLAIALIGGNAIAGERADRSAEFLYSLPVTRLRLLASKILFVLMITAVIWLLNAPLMWILVSTTHVPGDNILCDHMGQFWENVAITGSLCFCVAWLLSSYIASPSLAVCGGVIAPILVGCGLGFGAWLLLLSGVVQQSPLLGLGGEHLYWSICLPIAPLCFAVGTWHYLRRVEPW